MSALNRKMFSTKMTLHMTKEEIASLADFPYLILNEFHKSFKKDFSPESRHYGVKVFWDLKSTPIGNLSPNTLKGNILKALQMHQKEYFLLDRIYGFGDISGLTHQERKRFNQAGIFLRHAQKRGSYCPLCNQRVPVKSKYEDGVKTDLAETLLLRKMILHAYDIDPPGNILLITANIDFQQTIAELKDSGFKMMLATLDDADVNLVQTADLTWYWEEMKNREGPRYAMEPSTEERPTAQRLIAFELKLGVE